MLSDERRAEIATFLRNRRERLQPEQVGLPRGMRRRTPGLRREEVATLAGISPEWYTRLEQARDVNPSRDTLRAIAEALRLEPAESQHLLTLSGWGEQAESAKTHQGVTVSDNLQNLLDHLDYCPAWILGVRWDFMAWNRAATAIHGDLAVKRGIERNAIYQLFVNPALRDMLQDWEAHARDCVAKLRLAHAHYVDDPWFNELTRMVKRKSPKFAAWWDEHNVQLPRDGVKIYEHPKVGRLTFDYTILDVATDHGLPMKMITYVPVRDGKTRKRLEQLLVSSDVAPNVVDSGAPEKAHL